MLETGKCIHCEEIPSGQAYQEMIMTALDSSYSYLTGNQKVTQTNYFDFMPMAIIICEPCFRQGAKNSLRSSWIKAGLCLLGLFVIAGIVIWSFNYSKDFESLICTVIFLPTPAILCFVSLVSSLNDIIKAGYRSKYSPYNKESLEGILNSYTNQPHQHFSRDISKTIRQLRGSAIKVKYWDMETFNATIRSKIITYR